MNWNFVKRKSSYINKSGIESFSKDRFLKAHGIDRKVFNESANLIISYFIELSYKDTTLADQDQQKVKKLADAFGFSDQQLESLYLESKKKTYLDQVNELVTSGYISKEKEHSLEKLRKTLGLTKNEIRNASGTSALEIYRQVFFRVIDDWRITPEELDELARLRSITGLSKQEANESIQPFAMKVFRKWFINYSQDGEITTQERRALDWLRDEFELKGEEITRLYVQIDRINTFWRLRCGDLPRIQTNRLLEGDEQCHWDRKCRYHWTTMTKRQSVLGHLIVTSKQIIFHSDLKSFSFSPSKIIDIILYKNAIDIKTSSSRGSGTYYVNDPEMLEAIIVGIVRKHKYNNVRRFDSDLTRHIPDDVRREVYARDDGQCVKCKAIDYLEFDHIIPHAKGGANTVNNVQLLCRRCNQKKSDRI